MNKESLSNVFIVDNKCGDVFIVEDKSKKTKKLPEKRTNELSIKFRSSNFKNDENKNFPIPIK